MICSWLVQCVLQNGCLQDGWTNADGWTNTGLWNLWVWCFVTGLDPPCCSGTLQCCQHQTKIVTAVKQGLPHPPSDRSGSPSQESQRSAAIECHDIVGYPFVCHFREVCGDGWIHDVVQSVASWSILILYYDQA